MNIPWTAELVPHLVRSSAPLAQVGALIGLMGLFQPQLRRMAKTANAVEVDDVPPSSAQIVVNGVTVAFPLGDAIDLDAERAKPEAVEKARADHDARAAEAERLNAALARLG